MMRKLLSVFLILMLTFVAACSSGGSETTSNESNGASSNNDSSDSGSKKITLFTRTGPEMSDYMRNTAKAFTEKTGIEVEFVEQGTNGYFTNLTNQLVSGTDAFDIATTNSAYVGPLAAAGAIESLDGYMANLDDSYDLDDLAFKYEYDGKVYALPFDLSIQLLYYRSDLIDKAPETWKEYAELAKEWTQSKNPDSPTPYGAAWTAMAGGEQPKTFYSTMWSYGGFIVKDGEVGVGNEGAIEAGKLWQSMVKDQVVPPEIPNWGFPNVLDALKTGQIAMAAPMWNAAYNLIVNSDSPHKDTIKLAPVPGVEQSDGSIKRTPFSHSWSFVMNSQAKHKEEAWQFIEFVTGKEGSQIQADQGGTPPRYSILEDESMQPREYYDIVLESMKDAKYEPLVPYYLDQHDIMNKALSGIMTGTVDPETALKSAQDQLQTVLDNQ